jgi:hypothetical protein
MIVDVTVKTVEPTPTAVVVAATTWAEFPAIWGRCWTRCGAFSGAARRGSCTSRDTTSCCTKTMSPRSKSEFRYPGSFDPAGQVVASALPGGLVATAVHTGPMARIGDTHQAVREWSKANGYQLAGPRWEIYGDPDPSGGDFDVQVFWLLAAP